MTSNSTYFSNDSQQRARRLSIDPRDILVDMLRSDPYEAAPVVGRKVCHYCRKTDNTKHLETCLWARASRALP